MSWEQLSAILQKGRDERIRDKTEAPTACPNDGEPLVRGPRGVLHCVFDGWQWPRDAQR